MSRNLFYHLKYNQRMIHFKRNLNTYRIKGKIKLCFSTGTLVLSWRTNGNEPSTAFISSKREPGKIAKQSVRSDAFREIDQCTCGLRVSVEKEVNFGQSRFHQRICCLVSSNLTQTFGAAFPMVQLKDFSWWEKLSGQDFPSTSYSKS